MNNNIRNSYPLFSKYRNTLSNYRYFPIEEKDTKSASIFFSAIERNTQRKVLIKKFIKCLDKHHEFEAESYALENLNFEMIIKPIGIFEDEEYGYIVLPYAEGGDLYEIMHAKKTFFNDNQLKQIAFSVLSALEKIHSKGFIHRDIKLENIVFLKKYDELPSNLNNDDVLLIDFGSCYVESKSKSLSEFRGTSFYNSPEFIFHKKVTEKYDIYSLGVLLYYLAVAYLPVDQSMEYDEFEMKNLLDEKNIWRLFTGSKWDCISKEMKQLIQSMLLFDENIRPNAKELLKNEVFVDFLNSNEFENEYQSV